jgi:hypothetical protein
MIHKLDLDEYEFLPNKPNSFVDDAVLDLLPSWK